MTTGQVEHSTQRSARLARATAILLRHAIKCDRDHNWQMARICWTKYDHAYWKLQQEQRLQTALAGSRKNTSERIF
jgi:hypothetical protein